LEFKRFNRIKSFEKNPINGGTPAMEKKIIKKTDKLKKFSLKSLSEYRVLISVVITFCNVQKTIKNDIL
jgi:hypothetical protein